jgi:WD and tetratricopeptide repeat-containing protein 1
MSSLLLTPSVSTLFVPNGTHQMFHFLFNDLCYFVLQEQANLKFQKDSFLEAISLYNKAIKLYPTSAVLYGNRAAAFMKRKWSVPFVITDENDCSRFAALLVSSERLNSYFCDILFPFDREGDVYAALRDCYAALRLDPDHYKAHFR